TLQTESTYDWETEQWSVPVNAVASKLTRIGKQPVSLFAGLRYWAESPDFGPDGWGVRLGATFLFPR
ncbi:transporter, partial [Paracoccus sp. EF6]|nr:transporter [Paracoccus sp. EF6]